MGYDAFGLPAENNAIKTGEHPRDATCSIDAFRRDLRSWGVSIDWSREFATCDPRTTGGRSGSSCACSSAASPTGPRPCPVVPRRPNRPRQRAGDRRSLRALRLPGRAAQPRAVVLQDHRLRRPAAGRHRHPRHLARARPDDAAELDRRSDGAEVVFRCEELGLDFPVFTTRPGHAVRGNVLRPRPRASRSSSAWPPATNRLCATT